MQDLVRRYEAAQRRQQELAARAQHCAGRLEAAKKRYAELAQQAKEQFGVGSLAELEALVQRLEQENRRALQAWEQQAQQVAEQLDKIEAALIEAGL
ncbi:MAG: hypothetical protein N2690_00445 [Rhodocyclaceae bacterium]|nr:hypothetical protein [Rhodocyclaceae bacterium]